MDTTVEVLVDVKVEGGPTGASVTKVMRRLTFEGGILIDVGKPYEVDAEDFRAYLDRRDDPEMKWS